MISNENSAICQWSSVLEEHAACLHLVDAEYAPPNPPPPQVSHCHTNLALPKQQRNHKTQQSWWNWPNLQSRPTLFYNLGEVLLPPTPKQQCPIMQKRYSSGASWIDHLWKGTVRAERTVVPTDMVDPCVKVELTRCSLKKPKQTDLIIWMFQPVVRWHFPGSSKGSCCVDKVGTSSSTHERSSSERGLLRSVWACQAVTT